MSTPPLERIAIHILSDSLGETADSVATAAAAQFPPGSFRLERLPRVNTPAELRELVETHCGPHCIFFYTLAQEPMQAEMARIIAERRVNAVDVLGPGIDALERASGIEPSEEMGAMRRTDRSYFDRIEAMEYAVKHDDGRNPEGLAGADVVLIGVSRTSKTPLAMYLAFKGLKTANVPLAPGSAPPEELFEVDPRRIFGLVTDAEVLQEIRTARMRELGTLVPGYADREAIEAELAEARQLMRRIGCLTVHTDDRAVEESAQEIMRHLSGGVATED